MSDNVADMLTRIRNAQQVRHPRVTMPSSKLKVAIAERLREEGWLAEVSVHENGSRGKVLQVELKYDDYGYGIIRGLERISKPGRRVYAGWEEVPYVKNGLGTILLSTSKGVMTGRDARKQRVGGELLCKVW